MKRIPLLLAATLCLCCAVSARADWKRVAELQAGGGPKEVTVNRTVKCIQIQGYRGTCGVTTLWIRKGSDKTEHRITRTFAEGEKMNIDIPPAYVTGLRISDSGNGTYRINVYETSADSHRDRDRDRDYRDRDRDRDRDYYRDRDRRDRDYDDGYDDGYERGRRDAERRARERDRDRDDSWWFW